MDATEMQELDELEAALAELTVETNTVAALVSSDTGMEHITLDMLLAGYGVRKGETYARTFSKSKEVFRDQDVILDERAARVREQARKRQQRRRSQERRTKREKAMEAKPVDNVRLGACLALMGNLTHVITSLTIQRYNRFRRTLGDVLVEDIAQDATLRIAETLSKQTRIELVDLAGAAIWLKTAPQPYVSADGPPESGRLLGTIITVIGRVIQETYRANTTTAWVQTINDDGETVWEKKDTTLESFEYLETVAYNTRTDIDDLISNANANRKPFRKASEPGMREKRLFARMVVDCAIRARGLDWLATMLLDDERVRTDGSFKWTDNADTIWAGFGFPAMNTDSPALKAGYARRAVGIAFQFLPGVILAAYEIINDPLVMWHLDVHTTHELVEAAAQYRPVNYPDAKKYSTDPMDGGEGLAFSVELMDDPEKTRRALAMVWASEEGWEW